MEYSPVPGPQPARRCSRRPRAALLGQPRRGLLHRRWRAPSTTSVADDGRQPTVREAHTGSINLPFVRIMRDVVRHTIYQGPTTSPGSRGRDDPRRQEYLARFADREGPGFLRRFWEQVPRQEARRDPRGPARRPAPRRRPPVRGVPYLSPEGHAPGAGRVPQRAPRRQGVLRAEHRQALRPQRPRGLRPGRPGLRGAIHPLQLWLAAYLQNKPDATWADAVRDSAEAPGGLPLAVPHPPKGAKDSRIYTMLELEALWTSTGAGRGGLPFGHPGAVRSPPPWAAPATGRRRWPS